MVEEGTVSMLAESESLRGCCCGRKEVLIERGSGGGASSSVLGSCERKVEEGVERRKDW